jgi:hypothetical protein
MGKLNPNFDRIPSDFYRTPLPAVTPLTNHLPQLVRRRPIVMCIKMCGNLMRKAFLK